MSWKDMFPKENRYFETPNGILYNGDSLEIMKQFPDNVIDLVLTSPPYDNLRNYNQENIIDVWNFNKFKDTANIFFRIIMKGCVIVWVVGDATIKGSETATSFKQALYFKKIGFKLYDTMIYAKKNVIPRNHRRYEQSFEYMFILSKDIPKTFNAIKRKNKWRGTKCSGRFRQVTGKLIERHTFGFVKDESIKGNIWTYDVGYMKTTKDKIAYEHPAIFPEKLAKDHIVSWSNKNDLILDPFLGSGTTAVACEKLNRRWIGIEIEKKYCEIAKKRLIYMQRELDLEI